MGLCWSLSNALLLQTQAHAPVNLISETYDHLEICRHKDLESFVKHKREQARQLSKARQASRYPCCSRTWCRCLSSMTWCRFCSKGDIDNIPNQWALSMLMSKWDFHMAGRLWDFVCFSGTKVLSTMMMEGGQSAYVTPRALLGNMCIWVLIWMRRKLHQPMIELGFSRLHSATGVKHL